MNDTVITRFETGSYIGHIPDGRWQPMLAHYLEKADSFLVHMPDGEGELSFGLGVFRELPGVTVRPWDGMEDSVEFAGELTPLVKALFTVFERSLEDFRSGDKLWDYRLIQDGAVVLSNSDFHDVLIWPTGQDVARLTELGSLPGGWTPDH